jgi:hypothetical protein
MVGTCFPDQFVNHYINSACSSESGQSVRSNEHVKHQQVEDIHY